MGAAMSDGPGGQISPSALRERLLALVAQILGKPEAAATLSPEGRLSDLGMTSIKMVNLMLSVEVEFDVSIPQSDITPDNFRSVASIEALLLRILALKPQP
jgi:acyl carrier protein